MRNVNRPIERASCLFRCSQNPWVTVHFALAEPSEEGNRGAAH